MEQPDLNIRRLALRWCGQDFGRVDGEFTAKKEEFGELRHPSNCRRNISANTLCSKDNGVHLIINAKKSKS